MVWPDPLTAGENPRKTKNHPDAEQQPCVVYACLVCFLYNFVTGEVTWPALIIEEKHT